MATPQKPIVKMSSITKRFLDVTANNGIDFNLYPGEICALLGENGAGKTTTVRLLNGVLTPSGGTASVLGLEPVHDGPILRRHTGVLTETQLLSAVWQPAAETTARTV
mgnify:CR=1 FL=1